MISSWIVELRVWLQSRQKGIADQYSNRVVALMNTARQAKLSEESFHSFRSILHIGLEVIRDSAAALEVSSTELLA